MPVQYFYFQTRIPNASTPGGTQPTNPVTSLQLPQTPDIQPLNDPSNPIYNFSQRFIEQLKKITPLDLAQAVPIMQLTSMDQNGSEVTDYHKKYFSKPVNLSTINRTSERYTDRPDLSLEGVTVSVDLGGGTGLLAFNEIEVRMKLHRPSVLANEEIVNLLKPGTPLRLRYGWQCPNQFLAAQDLELFNVREYNITFDTTGEAAITIQGSTHQENFSNIFIGDLAVQITPQDVQQAAAQGASETGDPQIDGLLRQKLRVGAFFTYVNTQGTRYQNSLDYLSILYEAIADRTSIQVQKNFADLSFQLRRRLQYRPDLFDDVQTKTASGTVVQGGCVTLHDIMSILCGSTMDALIGTVLPPNRDYRIVYGSVNENCGQWSRTCLAGIPIHWKTFCKEISAAINQGIAVPSLQWLFNFLGSRFLSNGSYWRGSLCKGLTQIDAPDVNFQVSAHQVNGREIIQLSIVDIKQNVPLTTKVLREANQPLWTQQRQEEAVLAGRNIPVVRFGHANSYIKSISMSHHNDPTIKAALIKRVTDEQITSQRQPFTVNTFRPVQENYPLYIPLKGDMELLGHVDWRPGRFFYLESGVYVIDGMYIIKSVKHSLDAAGFTTHVEFTRN